MNESQPARSIVVGIDGSQAATKATDEAIQLTVIGKLDAPNMTQTVGPVTHSAVDRAGCSVLVVRD